MFGIASFWCISCLFWYNVLAILLYASCPGQFVCHVAVNIFMISSAHYLTAQLDFHHRPMISSSSWRAIPLPQLL